MCVSQTVLLDSHYMQNDKEEMVKMADGVNCGQGAPPAIGMPLLKNIGTSDASR